MSDVAQHEKAHDAYPDNSNSVSAMEADYTEQEERKIVRKIDWILLPILTFLVSKLGEEQMSRTWATENCVHCSTCCHSLIVRILEMLVSKAW